MKKLLIRDAEVMKLAVQNEITRSEDARYDHRLHGILLACSGVGCYEIAALLGHSPRTVQYWVRRFEKAGFAGLREGARKGRPPALDSATLREIGRDLRRDPREFGHAQGLWDGILLRHHIQARYGVSLGVRQCQRIFKRLGFRLRKPRPVIAKADPEAQRAFKKTLQIRQKNGR
jgi:transposase